MTPEEDAAWNEMMARGATDRQIEIQKEIRNERNRLLAASDWTQIGDAPVDRAAWAAYRQALRDLPSQPGFPAEIDWPIKPE